MLKINEKVAKSQKESQEHNTPLNAELSEALTKVSHLEKENNCQADKLNAEAQKCELLYHNMKTLKAENADLLGRLKMVLFELDTTKASLNRMNTGSKKLDDIMCSQKVHIDKHNIGYIDGATTSNAKCISCFVKNLVITNPNDTKNINLPLHIPSNIKKLHEVTSDHNGQCYFRH